MSNVATTSTPTTTGHGHAAGNGQAHHGHDPHLAHHFDTPEQQFVSAKLGMWIFLGTEILMFGGLFCAYAVYRHNHPDVFAYAHHALDKWLGALNTVVLITSSLTMAWGVRAAQLGQKNLLRWLLAVTILGGYIFLGVKSIEYNAKWHHVLFIGQHNQFRAGYSGPKPLEQEEKEKAEKAMKAELASMKAPEAGAAAAKSEWEKTAEKGNVSLVPADPNHGTPDEAKIRPSFASNQQMLTVEKPDRPAELELSDLGPTDQSRLYTFFGVYFFMTGLHGFHVIVGMALMAWILFRSLGPKNNAWAIPLIPGSIGLFLVVVGLIIKDAPGNRLMFGGLVIAALSAVWAMIWVPLRRNRSGECEFGPSYFTPVDLVGLYWHLVDLIWIFLFPLLYLIH